MVNEQKTNGVVKAAVSNGEMLSLLNMAGLKPSRLSPLAKISGQPAPVNGLQASGLVDSSNRPTPACVEALTILADPATEIDLIWGNPDSISLSNAYAAAGQERFVSYTAANGKSNISYFIAPQDFTDLMIEKLAFTEVKTVAPLNLEVAASSLPVLFALLDIYREAQLHSVLERRQEIPTAVTAEDANRVIQDSKMETDFNWYTPAGLNVLPPESAVTESTVDEGFRILKKEGIIGAGGELSDTIIAFANRAFPLAGFFGLKILKASGGSVEKTQLGMFRGLSSLLLVQLTSENNETRALVSSISTAQLPELLFNAQMRSIETPEPAVQAVSGKAVFCSKCGTSNTGPSKFCSKCGAPLAATASAKFCSKCGTPAAGGEKFCKKCGTPLK